MRARPIAAAAAALITTAGLVVAVPAPASAATFTVNSNGDQGDSSPGNGVCATAGGVCTLRAAVMEANAFAGSDVITVPAMTITLTAELPISSSMTVTGAGARATVLTATSGHRNLWVTAGTVSMSDLAVQDITTNAAYGAGIHQTNGNLTLTRIRVSNIRATGANSVYGPVLAEGGTLTLVDSEVSRNVSTSTGNTVYGGGVTAPQTSTVRIVNSTIADNQAVSTAGLTYFALGGGVYASSNSTVEVESSTLAGNAASNSGNGRGGNVYASGGGAGSVWVKDSVLAGGNDSAPTGGNCYVGLGGFAPTFAGRNVIDDATCGAATAERTIADAKLRAVGNYGGPTDTRPPAADSPALNAASECVTPADQRGVARPVAGACDLGAVELGSDLAVTVSASNGSPAPGADLLLTVPVTNNGPDTTTGTTASVSASAGGILSATPQSGTCSVSALSVSCALPDLPGGATTTIIVAARAPQAGSVTYSASVSAQQPDPNAVNNTATAQAAVPGSPAPPVTPVAVACGNLISGNGKPNRLKGTAAGDRIDGKAGNDRIKGLAGADCLTGAGGNDLLVGGADADKVSGGPGNDTVKVKDGVRDRVTCGGGRDTVVADKKDKVAKDCEVVRRR